MLPSRPMNTLILLLWRFLKIQIFAVKVQNKFQKNVECIENKIDKNLGKTVGNFNPRKYPKIMPNGGPWDLDKEWAGSNSIKRRLPKPYLCHILVVADF